MTGTQILEFFHGLIDNDSLDTDLELSLLNAAKEKLEATREWEFLKKLATITASTTPQSLPTDYFAPILVYVGDDIQPYMPVPFEQKPIFEDKGRYFCVDQANSQIIVLDTSVNGQTGSFYYLYSTPDITASTSPVFPERFHKILAYDMAKMFYAADQSDRNYSWAKEWDFERKTLFDLMCDWDERIKRSARENGVNRYEMTNNLQFDKYGFDLSDF